MRTELDSTLREIAERSRRETTIGGTVAEAASAAIPLVEDGNAQPVKKRASAGRRTRGNRLGIHVDDPPSGQFTKEALERALGTVTGVMAAAGTRKQCWRLSKAD